jgi:hypothetical protein
MLLVEETLVERRRSRSRIQRSNIVVIPPTVQNIRVQNVRSTKALGGLADVVYSRVDPEVLRVTHSRCFAAVDDLVAAGSRSLEAVGHVQVLGLVYGLDAVGVVVGHCGVGGPLDEAVDAAVDDHEGVDVQEGVFAVVVDEGAVGDLLVLFFEVGGEGWAVASALGVVLVVVPGSIVVWGIRDVGCETWDLRMTLLRSRCASRSDGRRGIPG